MDKETLSNYGWIVICVLVLAVMIALAGPFGTFVADAVRSTTAGLFDVNQNALGAAGINIDKVLFETCEHDYQTDTVIDCNTIGTITYACTKCGDTYTEERTSAQHTFDDANDVKCNVCNTSFINYRFSVSEYDGMVGTSMSSDSIANIPETFKSGNDNYKTTALRQFAFYKLNTLKELVMPNSVTIIEDHVFFECKNLEKVTFSTNLTKINANAFNGCESLASIKLPNTLTEIGVGVFANCTNLTEIIFEGTVDEWNNVVKGNYWKSYVPAVYIQCSDGTVSLK